MIPPLPINDRHKTYSCRLGARHSRTRTLTRKRPAQPTVHSLAPNSSPPLRRKNISAPALLSIRLRHCRAQIPIAPLPHQSPAAPPAHYLSPRFRALALFGRRPPQRAVSPRFRRPKTCTLPDLSRCSKMQVLQPRFTRSPRRQRCIVAPGSSRRVHQRSCG